MRVGRHILLLIACIALACVMGACRKTQPQRPTHKGEVHAQDSVLIRLAMLNERMAGEADKQIQRYVKENDIRAYQMDCGAWKMQTRSRYQGDTIVPKKGEVWSIECYVYSLQDSLLEVKEQEFRYLVDPMPSAIQEAMEEMHHGDTARLICPWYTAFGPAGTMVIQPYYNCIIDINIQ